MNVRNLLLFCALAISLLLYFCTNNEQIVKVMSFNVRYDNPDDGINAWSNRKAMVFSFLNDQQPDIIGFQEVLKHQYKELSEHLDDYSSIGVGRDDGKDQGEFVPVFYRKDKYELLASSHFWLSESPEVIGSKSWGAILPRIVTWLQLKDRRKGYIFYVFNTHFSHVSTYARNQSAVLLLNKIKTIAGQAPVVLTGDFNAQPSEQMYSTIIDNWEGYYALWDSRHLPLNITEQNYQTFNGFNPETPEVIIDHIFVNGFFDVKSFNTFQIAEDDMYISDHYPIQSELTFRLVEKEHMYPTKLLKQSLVAPLIRSTQLAFEDSLLVEIQPQGHNANIYYTLDGTQPDTTSCRYQKQVVIKQTSTLKARAFDEGMYDSKASYRSFIKRERKDFKLVEVIPTSDNKYSSPAYTSLFDDLSGNIDDIEDGSWIGFNGTDVDFLFDQKRKSTLTECHLSFLNNPNKWIILPSKIEVKVSNDGMNYKLVAQTYLTPSYDTGKNEQQLYTLKFKAKARYLKLSVYNGGLLPKSHSGGGNPSWLFLDEIIIQ